MKQLAPSYLSSVPVHLLLVSSVITNTFCGEAHSVATTRPHRDNLKKSHPAATEI